MMVSSRSRPVKEGPFFKPKQVNHIGKNVRHVKGQSRAICSGEEITFTQDWYKSRRDINEAVTLYRQLLTNKRLRDSTIKKHMMSPDRRKDSGLGLHLTVAKLVEYEGKSLNTTQQIGCVKGIAVGDEFHWRGELCIAGLHCDYQKGIHYFKLPCSDTTMAASIVDSSRYDSAIRVPSRKLTYCGEGRKNKDQEPVRGNLALMHNCYHKRPVRVIRKFDNVGNSNGSGYKFVYEGLHRVTGYVRVRKTESSPYVYRFELEKLEDDLQYDSDCKKKNIRIC